MSLEEKDENNLENVGISKESLCFLWDECSKIYIRGRNGDLESYSELEKIVKKVSDSNDIICLGYFSLLVGQRSELYKKEKYQEIIQEIIERISQFTINSIFLSSLRNQHEQYIYASFFEEGIGVEKNLEESFRLNKLSADQGFALAQCLIGYYYYHGFGVTRNEELSFEYYYLAAKQGLSIAQCAIGINYEEGSFVEKNESEAIVWYTLAANQGCLDAQNYLGCCYCHGTGVIKNDSLAFHWYKKSADRGDANGQVRVGWCYLYGRGVLQDKEEGLKWYKKAVDQGNSEAQYYLGDYYLKSNDESLKKEGYQLLKLSAINGDEVAQYVVGMQYYHGNGQTMDEEEALKWFKLSADQHDVNSITLLGECYHYGRIVKKDRLKSFDLFKNVKLLESEPCNYLLALNYLYDSNTSTQTIGFQYLSKIFFQEARSIHGLCYEYGIGVEINENDAFIDAIDSSSNESVAGHYTLGRYYEEGIGIFPDIEEAKRMYELAAENGSIDAIIRLKEHEEDKVPIRVTYKRKYESINDKKNKRKEN